MNDLVKALQVLAKYTTEEQPTRCEYRILQVLVNPAIVSPEDIAQLEELGFYAGDVEGNGDPNWGTFYSDFYGTGERK